MKAKHSFVSLLDLPEILPFAKKCEHLDDINEECMKALANFVDLIAKQMKEEIHYIGQDNIGEKFYERFLFKKGGFMEIMTQPPVAIVGHFIEEKRAKKFSDALKKSVLTIKDPVAKLVADSIEVESEEEQVLDYKTWSKLKDLREDG